MIICLMMFANFAGFDCGASQQLWQKNPGACSFSWAAFLPTYVHIFLSLSLEADFLYLHTYEHLIFWTKIKINGCLDSSGKLRFSCSGWSWNCMDDIFFSHWIMRIWKRRRLLFVGIASFIIHRTVSSKHDFDLLICCRPVMLWNCAQRILIYQGVSSDWSFVFTCSLFLSFKL